MKSLIKNMLNLEDYALSNIVEINMKSISDTDKFVKMVRQTKSLIAEFSILSKKSPNDAVNKFKIKLINPILAVANNFIGDAEYKPFDDFEIFDEEDVPTNSDILVVLSQYNACLGIYFDDNTVGSGSTRYWRVGKKPHTVKAPYFYNRI